MTRLLAALEAVASGHPAALRISVDAIRAALKELQREPAAGAVDEAVG